jgi:sulfatase modifying factor 1
MRVFISYAREDKATAQRLYDDLKKNGADPWLDVEALLPGQNWKLEIGTAIRNCDYFLALLSLHSVSKRGYVQKELKTALDILGECPKSRIFIIPVRLDDCQPIDEELKELHWLDLFSSYDRGLAKILQVLKPGKKSETGLIEPAPLLGTKNKLVRIPGGTFLMGDEEEGQFQAAVKDFWMDMYPVTQALYRQVMGKNPSRFEGDGRPVERVSWFDAVKFCNQLSEKMGLEPVYKIVGEQVAWQKEKNGFRLPTEAEWEYACRAGTIDYYSSPIDGIAWYYENSGRSTQGVGQKKPNDFGLYDMLGNVWEWVWDWYAGYPSEPTDNPSGPDTGSYRVGRGGSWFSGAHYCRSAIRGGDGPGSRGGDLGVRLSRSLP